MPLKKLLPGLFLLMLLAACDGGSRYSEVILVTPQFEREVLENPPHKLSERNAATLATFQSYGDLQVMTYCGDFDQVVDFQHHQLMSEFVGGGAGAGTPRVCSMFEYRTGRDSGLVGRNFDSRETQVLAAWFYPTEGYASVALLPLADLGYTPERPFDPANEQHRKNLLYAPVMTIEGMNEKGVVVALASLGRRPVTQDSTRKPRFLIHLVREILDHAGSVYEAVAIAEKFNVFDNGREAVSHQILLADSHSGSVVLVWRDGLMHLIKDTGTWQVVTNSDMFEVSLADREHSCKRYKSLSRIMAAQEDGMTWQEAMDALSEVKQKNKSCDLDGERWRVSTQWSAVFDTDQREIHLVLAGDYNRVYRLLVGEGI